MAFAPMLSLTEIPRIAVEYLRSADTLHARGAISIETQQFLLSTVLNCLWSRCGQNARIEILADGATYYISGTQANSDVPFAVQLREWAAGRTIVANHIYEYSRELQEVCRASIHRLSKLLHFNSYWTPPASRGSGRHCDEHDVAVLQCYGEKIWRIWNGEEILDFTVRSGDLLLIRAGVYHAPFARDRSSLHITLGISDFLTSERKQRASERFHAGLSPQIAVSNPEEFFQTYDALWAHGLSPAGRRSSRRWFWRPDLDVKVTAEYVEVCAPVSMVTRLPHRLIASALHDLPAPMAQIRFTNNVGHSEENQLLNFLVSRSLISAEP